MRAFPPPTGSSVVIRRTEHGWQVGDDPADTDDDLTSAMALADLLGPDAGAGNPPRTDTECDDEAARLRVAVRQLEHALA